MKGLILVTGSDGMVGSRFVELTKRRNYLHLPTQVELDITKYQDVKDIVDSYNFAAVVNFAAYTNVSEAENQRGDKEADCWQVNVEGVRNFVKVIKAKKARIHFIQISTDMVFSGGKDDPGPYGEDHLPESQTEKVTWYGYTKAQAEKVVSDELGEYATIVRLIYPVRAKYDLKLDYLRRLLKLFDEGKLYPLFKDQQMSITFIDQLCEVLDKVIIDNKNGVFHVSCPDTTTPYELVSYMLEGTRGKSEAVEVIGLNDFLTRNNIPEYRYPKFGGLKVEETQRKLGVEFLSWKKIVDKLIEQGINY